LSLPSELVRFAISAEVLARVSPAEGHTDAAEQRDQQQEPPELDLLHCRHSLAGNAVDGRPYAPFI
jgi:hypothetical protein